MVERLTGCATAMAMVGVLVLIPFVVVLSAVVCMMIVVAYGPETLSAIQALR